jgi:Tol biopolymer transport system component
VAEGYCDADWGINLHKLTTTSSRSESGAVFSPDGSKVVFSGQNLDERKADLFLVDADGTELDRISDTPGRDGYPLAWQPG